MSTNTPFPPVLSLLLRHPITHIQDSFSVHSLLQHHSHVCLTFTSSILPCSVHSSTPHFSHSFFFFLFIPYFNTPILTFETIVSVHSRLQHPNSHIRDYLFCLFPSSTPRFSQSRLFFLFISVFNTPFLTSKSLYFVLPIPFPKTPFPTSKRLYFVLSTPFPPNPHF